MSRPTRRWVLAFNASCGACRTISAAVAEVTAGKLEVLPLARPEVAEWRTRSLGEDAPLKPTLLRVGSDDAVRGWTGVAMAVPLIRRLGLRSTIAVMNELGRLKRQEDDERPGLTRKSFLRLGAGATVAVGLLATGQVPAFAVSEADVARKWVEANLDRLPQTYDAVIKHPMAYRKAIYQRLPAAVQRQLWADQLKRYLGTHPDLASEQVSALDGAVKYLSSSTTDLRYLTEEADRHEEAILATFGRNETGRLIAVLGPDDRAADGADQVCDCNFQDDWCFFSTCRGTTTDCAYRSDGCGRWYQSSCNGLCE